jgi:hypothetical protein
MLLPATQAAFLLNSIKDTFRSSPPLFFLSRYTANEGLLRIQYKCLVPIYVFPEMKLLLPKQNYNVLSPIPTLIYL